MAKDETVVEVSGLQLSNNTFSASPPGSLLRAEEVVMPQKGVIEPRRGQGDESTLPSPTDFAFSFAEFDGTVIVNYAPSKASTSYGLKPIGGSAYSGGPYNPVDTDGSSIVAPRMKFGFSGEYLNFCTTSAPMTLEDAAGTPRAAGLIRMPDVISVMSSAAGLGTTGEGLEYGKSRAYKSVLRKPTSNGVSLLSPPSGASVIRNELTSPIGGMTRSGGATVTVVFPAVQGGSFGLGVGDSFTLSPGEANFPAGSYTVASTTATGITYASAGANVSNTVAQSFNTGPRPVTVVVPLTTDATTSTPVRIYRTLDFDSTPDDEYFLVAEVFPTGGNISAGFLTYSDTTPEIVLNDPLYTNPLTGEGPREVNNRPPIYRDTANWSQRQWYSNTTGLQQLRIQMLGVGSPDGVQNNDTITIDGTVFTFKTTPAAPGDVQIFSDSTPSANISRTSAALIEEIFELFRPSGSNTPIRGYYESTQTGAPGLILLEATTYTQGVFAVDASRVKTWTPALPANSQAERTPNAIAYSKVGQAESVPPLNYLPIGSKNFPISRIIGLQQALLVFKEGDGIYAVTGSAPFNVQQISTSNIIATDTACQFADAAWAYTDEGILRVSDSGGSTCISRPIETELLAQLALLPEETRAYSFAIPYETERRVLFFVPFDTEDGRPVLRAWCYNNATQAWTGPLYSDVFGGVVSSTEAGFLDKRLYLGIYDSLAATSRITKERNGNNPGYLNYVDIGYPVTISAVSTDHDDNQVVQFSTATRDYVDNGDLLVDVSPARGAQLESREDDLGDGWFQPLGNQNFSTGGAFIYKHIPVSIQFQPQGAPASRKTLTRLAWLFKPEWYSGALGKTYLACDQVQADAEVATPSYGFGELGFGTQPFGDPTPMVVDVNPLPVKQSSGAQFFPGLSMPVAWNKLKLQGFVIRLETAESPTGRGR